MRRWNVEFLTAGLVCFTAAGILAVAPSRAEPARSVGPALPEPSLVPRAFLPVTVQHIAPVVSVRLDPADTVGVVGREQWYDVRIHDVVGLRSLGITVRYDPSQLQVIDEDPNTVNVQIAPGEWPLPEHRAAWPVAFNDSGTMYIPMYTFGPSLYGSASIARFRVRPQVPGSAWLRIERASLDVGIDNQRLEPERHDARIVVAPSP